MPVSSLIPLFNVLKDEDISYCRDYICSPIHNASARSANFSLVLYEVLVKNRKKEIEDKNLWEKSCKMKTLIEISDNTFLDGGIYDKIAAKKLSHLKSKLADLIEDYLAFKEFRKDTMQKNIYLLKALRSHQLDDCFQKTYDIFRIEANQSPLQNSEYHLYNAKMKYEYYHYYVEKKRSLPNEFKESNEHFTYYAISQRLGSICQAISNKQVVSMGNTLLNALDNQVINFSKQLIEEEPTTPIIIKIHFACYEMLTTGKKEHFELFKTLLIHNYSIFDYEEFIGLMGITINFVTKKLNTGEHSYLDEQFELFKIGLEEKAFGVEKKAMFNKKNMSSFIFKNIIFVASRKKEFVWAERLINDYRNSNIEEDIVNYCSAILTYHKSEYNATIKFLSTIKLKDSLFEFDIRRMMVRCSFEEKEGELLKNQLLNFKKYIDLKRVALGYQYENYKNFIFFTSKIYNLKAKAAKIPKKLIADFNSTINIAEREWLASKMGV